MMGHEKKKTPVLEGAGISRSPDLQSHSGNGGLDHLEDAQAEELYPTSPSPASSISSSPPQDFEVNPEGQYMPILDDEDQDYADEEFVHEGTSEPHSSLASSMSLQESNNFQGYNSSPVIFSTTTPSGQPYHHHIHHPQQNLHRQHPTKTSNSSRVIRCPVCEKPMRTFYCAKCIQTGKFVTLDHNHQLTENKFSQTTIEYNNSERLYDATAASSSADAVAQAEPKIVTEEEVLQIKLRALARRTEALKVLYNEQQAKLEQTRRLVDQTRQQLVADKKSHRSRAGKIDLIKRYITSRKASVKKRHDAQANCLEELRQHSSRRVYQLTQDVFPLDEVNLFEQQNGSFVNMETSPLLTFSDGSHHQIEQLTAYSIVEPWLPSNGDYSAYSLWVTDNKDQLQAPVEDYSPERSPAFRIGAALAYTTQFVKNLANYLDVILPAQMNLDMFSRELLEDAQFSYNVAKLNANVIHLCVAQGVDLSLLQSQRTLKNLSLLFNLNLCDLGRKPIIDLESVEEVAQRIETQLANDLTLIREDLYDFSKFAHDEEEDDNEEASDSEWEISDNITNPIELQMVEQSQIQQNSYISRPLRLFSSFWTASGS